MRDSLVNAIREIAYKVAIKRLSHEDAEDVASRVVLRLLQYNKPEHYHQAYIYSCAINELSTYLSKGSDMPHTPDWFANVADGSNWPSAINESISLECLIEDLPTEEREVLMYRASGHSLAEVGERYGLSEGAAKSRIHRILNKLHDPR